MRNPVLAARVFGVYLAATGVTFASAPGVALPMFGLAVPHDVWVRVVGLVTLILGLYFLYCAQPDQRRFFQATVFARLTFFTGITTFVVAGLAPAVFLVFAGIDVAGAAWMQYALHATRARA